MDSARAGAVVALLVLGVAGGVLVDRTLLKAPPPPDELARAVESNSRAVREVAAQIQSRDRSASPQTISATGAPVDVVKAVKDALEDRELEQDAAKQVAQAPTRINQIAFDRGLQLVGDAVSRGHWTTTNDAELESLDMTPAQHLELRRKLAQAINQDKLVADSLGRD